MTKLSLTGMLIVAGFGGVGGANAQTGKTNPMLAAVRTIRANAEEAGQNAAIYQWMRVNREVDRVAASLRTVEKGASGDGKTASALPALQQGIRELRAARLAHDVTRLQDASRKVMDACDALAK